MPFKLSGNLSLITLTLALMLGLCLPSSAQIKSRINLSYYDEHKIHFGFLMGLNYSTFRLQHSPEFSQMDTVAEVYSTGGPGFQLGFIVNYRLGEYFDLRALPQVSFYERRINYRFNFDNDSTSSTFGTFPMAQAVFESSIIELPILFKYKSHRRGNTRLYMVGGLKASFEVGAKRRQQRNDQIAQRSFGLSLDYGIGLDRYFPLFKLAPELRFSLGITEMFKKDDNLFSAPVQSIRPYTVSLSFLFE